MSTDIRVIYFASCDVFDNLALEELLLVERTREQIVIAFYQNADSVVIGRHQNPWIECDVPALQADRIALARRVSGGGAVYHDRGNLNYSVILARERYDRNAVFDALLSGLAQRHPGRWSEGLRYRVSPHQRLDPTPRDVAGRIALGPYRALLAQSAAE